MSMFAAAASKTARRVSMFAAAASKTARRVNMFAAKFAADTVCAQPPRFLAPTDAALRAGFAGCAKPAPAVLYPAFRAAFLAGYHAQITAARTTGPASPQAPR